MAIMIGKDLFLCFSLALLVIFVKVQDINASPLKDESIAEDKCDSIANMGVEYFADASYLKPCFVDGFQVCLVYMKFSWEYHPVNCSLELPVEFKLTVPYRPPPEPLTLPKEILEIWDALTDEERESFLKFLQVPLEHCPRNFTWIGRISSGAANLTLTNALLGYNASEEYTFHPLQVNCSYIVEIVVNGSTLLSYPLNTTFEDLGDPSPHIVSVETQSDYNRSIAAYDTELTIEVYGNPRVTEVVLLFGQRNRFTGIGVDIFESSFFYLEPRPFQPNKDIVTVYDARLHLKPFLDKGEYVLDIGGVRDNPFLDTDEYVFDITVRWVSMSFLPNDRETRIFSLRTPAHPPSEVRNVSVSLNGTKATAVGRYIMNITWLPPLWPNGDGVCYDVLIANATGSEQLFLNTSCSEESYLVQNLTAMDGAQLVISVRARNEYELVSNWSRYNVTVEELEEDFDTKKTIVWLPALSSLVGILVAGLLFTCCLRLLLAYVRKWRTHHKILASTTECIVMEFAPNTLAEHACGVTGKCITVDMSYQIGAGMFGAVFLGSIQPNPEGDNPRIEIRSSSKNDPRLERTDKVDDSKHKSDSQHGGDGGQRGGDGGQRGGDGGQRGGDSGQRGSDGGQHGGNSGQHGGDGGQHGGNSSQHGGDGGQHGGDGGQHGGDGGQHGGDGGLHLGDGGQDSAVGGARLPPGELVAVKFIDVISDTDAENPQNSMTGMTEGQILNEISILKKLNSSEYVVKLVFCTQAHFRVILGLELMPHGSLLYNLEETKIWRGKQVSEVPSAGRSTVPSATLPPDRPKAQDSQIVRIRSIAPITEEQMVHFAWQIAEGMEYIAGKDIIHRDLSASNILVGEDNTVKITDFGLSCVGDTYISNGSEPLPLRWMAPESLKYGIFTSKSDVWSYGVLLWEMWTLGSLPYEEVPDGGIAHHVTEEHGRLHIPESCPREMSDMMMNCWEEGQEERPDFHSLKNRHL